MEKENLDDLMREKFDTEDPGARFEFREEYWEQAQALLEADERKRKRRFLWWWWLGAGCLLLAVGGWFGYAHGGGGDQPGTGQKTSLSRTGDATNAQGNNELGEKQMDSQAKPADLGNPACGSLRSKSMTGAGELMDSKEKPTDKKNPADRSLAGMPTTAGRKPLDAKGERADLENPAGESLAGKPTTTAGKPTTAGRKPLDAKGERADLENPANGSLAVMPTTAVETPSSSKEKPADPKKPAGKPLTGTSATAASTPAGNAGLPSTTSTGLPAGNTGLPPVTAQPTGLPAGNLGNNVGIIGHATLPKTPTTEVLPKLPAIDFQTLVMPPNVPFFPKAPQAAQEIKPQREPRFSLGLGASASAFFPKNSAAQWGGTAGIFADYRLSRSFSLNAGVAWRYVPMSSPVADSTHKPQVSEQLRYSFGYVKTQSSIRSEGLHTLELPLAMRWHRGPWHLEGGASVSCLLGVRGDLTEERSTSLQPLPVTTKKKIWADDQPYRHTWLSPMAGAGWQRGRWSVSLRAVLFPLDVAPPLIPDEPRPSGWRPSMDVGLRYRIF